MKNKGLAILYLSVGSGHQTAAEALGNLIKKRKPNVSLLVEDPFANKIEVLPSVLGALQTVSNLLAPDLYDLAWRRKVSYDKYQWLEDINLLQEYLKEVVLQKNIDRIIATHVLPSILGVGLKKRGLIKGIFSVITDYGAHSFWPTAGIDGYFVATNELKNTLIYRGVDPSVITVTGIPINNISSLKDFIKPIGKRIKILMIAGGVRNNGYTHIQESFSHIINNLRSQKNVDITIVTGKQKGNKKKLQTTIQNIASKPVVLGFIHDMPKLIAMHDILITKPGGLIVSEALAVGSCLVLLKPGPGQESANKEFLTRNGLALNGETPEDAVKSINHLINNPQLIIDLKEKTKLTGNPDATEKIINKIFQ